MVIQKEKGKWFLYSRKTHRRLGGPYDTKEQALRREREVQYFKHRKG